MSSLQYPQIHLIYNRRGSASPTHKAAVEIRISHNYKQKYISTGIMLYPNQWKNGSIVNCGDIMYISKVLDKKISDVRQVIYDMMEEGHIDLSSIQRRLRIEEGGEIDFLQFCEQRVTIKKYNKSKGRQNRYDCFLRILRLWGKIKDFQDITEQNIILFDKYLSKRDNKPYSRWQNYHKILKAIIKDAMDSGYNIRNPYNILCMDKGDSMGGRDRYLTPEEFDRLKSTTMPTACLSRVKDLFIFQTYTCLRYSDLALFNTDNILEVKGMKVYVGNCKKTSIAFTIPLLSPALEILSKYDNRLPIISNVKYNKYLKQVALEANIDKPLSSHWARHTGATLLLNEGIDMQIVSRICGHSSTKITEQIYAKLLDETVVMAVQRLKERDTVSPAE